MRVLVVAPHPDDEVLGCGGMMARHAQEGDEVHVALVTRGVPDLFPPEQVAAARRELAAAHQVLGVAGVRFLDFPAPRMDTVPRHQVADKLGEVFRELKPETLYIPHAYDLHFEHGLIHEACLVAARPLAGNTVRRILAYETMSETDWAPPRVEAAFVPQVFIDITAYLEKKLQAMQSYASQVKSHPHPRSLDNLRALAHLRGATAGLQAAEAFMLVREIR